MSENTPKEFMRRGYSNPDGMSTDSLVFRVMSRAGEPVSIQTLHKSEELRGFSEQTIRRSINRLMKIRSVQLAGNDGPTKFYAPLGTDMRAMNSPNPKVIPYAGGLITVEEFLTLMLDMDVDPFKPNLKKEIFEIEFLHWLRKRFVYSVITAGDSGYDEQLKNIQVQLSKVHRELDRIVGIIGAWTEAPIWYDQYRDQIAFQTREVQKENPDLIQLAHDYIQS